MYGLLDAFLSLQNILPGNTPIIEWTRFKIYLVGYIFIAVSIFLGVYLLKRFSKHSFLNTKIVVSFSISITCYFYFLWSYIFSYLIFNTSDYRYPYKKEVMIIPFIVLITFFFCTFIGSFIWLVISHRKMMTDRTLSKTLTFDCPFWFLITYSLGILIFLPFYYIFYNLQILKINISLPENLVIILRFFSIMIIICSVFSFVACLIGISFILNANFTTFKFLNNKGFIIGFPSLGTVLLLISIIYQFLLKRIIKEFVFEK